MEGEIYSPKANYQHNAKRQYRDYFLWPLLFLPFLTSISFDIYSSIHSEHEIDAAFLAIFLGLLWLFFIGILILFALWHKLQKMTISLLLSLVFWLWATPTLLNWFPVGDYVHLYMDYPAYKVKIDAFPNERLAFDWGGTGFSFTVNSDRTLIYDPSDKLPDENKIKDAQWRKESRYVRNGHEYFQDWVETRHLFGHFYLVEAWHQ